MLEKKRKNKQGKKINIGKKEKIKILLVREEVNNDDNPNKRKE